MTKSSKKPALSIEALREIHLEIKNHLKGNRITDISSFEKDGINDIAITLETVPTDKGTEPEVLAMLIPSMLLAKYNITDYSVLASTRVKTVDTSRWLNSNEPFGSMLETLEKTKKPSDKITDVAEKVIAFEKASEDEFKPYIGCVFSTINMYSGSFPGNTNRCVLSITCSNPERSSRTYNLSIGFNY